MTRATDAEALARAVWATVPDNGEPLELGSATLTRPMVQGEPGYCIRDAIGTVRVPGDDANRANRILIDHLRVGLAQLPTGERPTDLERMATETMRRDILAAGEALRDEYFDDDPRAHEQAVRRRLLQTVSAMLAASTGWHDTFVRALRQAGVDLGPLRMDPAELAKYDGDDEER